MTKYLFRDKRPNADKLLAFGFQWKQTEYIHETDLMDGHMKLFVRIALDGTVCTQILDLASGDEYILHRVPGAAGAFVGQVKAEYEAVLQEIADRCFAPDVFKTEQAKQIIAYIRERYDDELEFLWKKFPDNAIWRRKDTNKWYAAILTVSARKLGLDCDNRLEILDLRLPPEEMAATVDHQRFFPGYHMNKKHWYTLILDGSVETEEICKRIEESYILARKCRH